MATKLRTRDWSGEDYYAALGVSRYASPAQIDDAYRARAKEFHPDRNPGDPYAEERFKQIATAYGVLRDPATRAAYDDFRLRVASGSLYDRPAASTATARATAPGSAYAPARRAHRPSRPMPRWLRLTIGWTLVALGIAVAIVMLAVDLPVQGPDSKAGVVITFAIAALKLVVGGVIVLNYPRLKARWHRPAIATA
jgi:hypothetical protein